MKGIFANADAGLIGLLFFFIVFCTIVLWTFRPWAKEKYKDHGRIPLEEKE